VKANRENLNEDTWYVHMSVCGFVYVFTRVRVCIRGKSKGGADLSEFKNKKLPLILCHFNFLPNIYSFSHFAVRVTPLSHVVTLWIEDENSLALKFIFSLIDYFSIPVPKSEERVSNSPSSCQM